MVQKQEKAGQGGSILGRTSLPLLREPRRDFDGRAVGGADLCTEDGRLGLGEKLVHLVERDLFADHGGLDLVVWVGRHADGAVGELPAGLRVDEALQLGARKVEIAADALLADRGEGALDRVERHLACRVLKLADLGGVLAHVRVLGAVERRPELAESGLEEQRAELRKAHNQRVRQVARRGNVLGLLHHRLLLVAASEPASSPAVASFSALTGTVDNGASPSRDTHRLKSGKWRGHESLEQDVDHNHVVEVGRVELVPVWCKVKTSRGTIDGQYGRRSLGFWRSRRP
ncbi:hypothetical protein L1887_53705 [Cichorium endivia]|nr:hypothetical protein L1887_53705 [Cichorium endivia]